MKNKFQVATKGLAGAMAIAGGSHAYGAIVNVTPPANPTTTVGTTTSMTTWDVNGDGTADFTFSIRYPNNPAQVVWQDNMTGSGSNSVLGYGAVSTYRYGSAFSTGTSIGAAAPAGTGFETAIQTIMGSLYGGTPYGGFASTGAPGTGSVAAGTLSYAGFSFVVGTNTYYGWLKMSANADSMNFMSAAYNNTPGTSILAGASAVPEPGMLAGLAAGATALGGLAWRRRRATV